MKKQEQTLYWIIGIILIGIIVGNQLGFVFPQFEMVGYDTSAGYIFIKSWCSYQEYWDEPYPPYFSDYEKTMQEDVPNEIVRLNILGYSNCYMIDVIHWENNDRYKPCISVVCTECPPGMEKATTIPSSSINPYNTGTCVCPEGTERIINEDGLIICVLPEEEMDFYRVIDNMCSLVTILPSSKTVNDYDTLEECEEHLIIEEKEYYRLQDGECSLVTILSSAKTINDYDTLEECEQGIEQEIICLEGFEYNSITNKCEKYPEQGIVCTQGTYNSLTGQCEIYPTTISVEAWHLKEVFKIGEFSVKLWMLLGFTGFIFLLIMTGGKRR